MLSSTEWNRNKDRTVDLHRHPCFIGPVESVMHDCCGSCPKPKTDDEREIAEDENKIFVFGDVAFMKDDPGRQAIGSFNPLTDDDWTDMAYIGNTQELCQKICDQDLSFVQDWCGKNPESINRRDHTGRTPLHVAAQCSTPEILKCLVDHGARIVARLVDGMTALHIVAARGSVDMVTTLLERSEANEAEEAEKEEKKKIAAKQGKVRNFWVPSSFPANRPGVTEIVFYGVRVTHVQAHLGANIAWRNCQHLPQLVSSTSLVEVSIFIHLGGLPLWC